MAPVSFSYKPKGLAIGREQIQEIAGGLEGFTKNRPQKYKEEKKAGRSQYWGDSMDFEPRFIGGTRTKKILTWEEDGSRDSRHYKNARAHHEHHRPSDHSTIRHMH